MRKKTKEENFNFFRIFLGFLLSAMYCIVAFLLSKIVYNDYLYFKPVVYVVLIMVIAFIIFATTFLIKKEHIVKMIKSIKSRFIVCGVVIVTLCFPILFIKCGTVADDVSIQKKNIFGNTTQALYYEEIKSIEVSVRRGIQYEIEFETNDKIVLFSDELIVIKNFKTDENLMQFDKAISQYAKKTVWNDEYLTQKNIRRFIKNQESFNYFDDFFSQYY